MPLQSICLVCSKSQAKRRIKPLKLNKLNQSSKAGCHRCFVLLQAAKCFIFRDDYKLSEWSLDKDNDETYLNPRWVDPWLDPTLEFLILPGKLTFHAALWSHAER
jgi:hypothetical protein